jgi:hypothetical protein
MILSIMVFLNVAAQADQLFIFTVIMFLQNEQKKYYSRYGNVFFLFRLNGASKLILVQHRLSLKKKTPSQTQRNLFPFFPFPLFLLLSSPTHHNRHQQLAGRGQCQQTMQMRIVLKGIGIGHVDQDVTL